MTTSSEESRPARVPLAAKQAGEIPANWLWVEPSIWTPRMLTALVSGVQGGKWFSLIDKVYAPGNLLAAFARVAANGGAAGVDHQTVEQYASQLAAHQQQLAQQLRQGTYCPQAVRRVWINKPGRPEKRPLGIPTVRDRVAQTALRHVLEPIFERDFAAQSYGFRPQRGAKQALRRVDELLSAGYTWVVDADLKSYYDTIPHEPLLARIAEKVSDGRVIKLLASYLQQGVLEGMASWTPEEGTPQGAVISPLLSNIYLDPLDHLMATKGVEMVRYADDFVILCREAAAATAALAWVQEWTSAHQLTLHPQKTRIVDATQRGGFDFLGYHFERGYKWPRPQSIQKLRDAIRRKTRRNEGHSLSTIIEEVNLTLQGWFEYFQHSHKTTFGVQDKWVRMRLRSVLRRRQGLRGRERGTDHRRWPNAYFAQHGLYSLVAAHEAVCQSSGR